MVLLDLPRRDPDPLATFREEPGHPSDGRQPLKEQVVFFDLPTTNEPPKKGEAETNLSLNGLVLQQSLRQSRQFYLHSFLPVYSTKVRNGPHVPVASTSTSPPPVLVQLGLADVVLGPHIFYRTRIWEVREEQQVRYAYSSPAAPSRMDKGKGAAVPATQRAAAAASSQSPSTPRTPSAPTPRPQVPGPPQPTRPISSASTAASSARPPPTAAPAWPPPTSTPRPSAPASTPRPPPPPPSTSARPSAAPPVNAELVARVNAAASANPALSHLLHLAASGRANQEQLKALGVWIQAITTQAAREGVFLTVGSPASTPSPATPPIVANQPPRPPPPRPPAPSRSPASTSSPAVGTSSVKMRNHSTPRNPPYARPVAQVPPPVPPPSLGPPKIVLEFKENSSTRFILPLDEALIERTTPLYPLPDGGGESKAEVRLSLLLPLVKGDAGEEKAKKKAKQREKEKKARKAEAAAAAAQATPGGSSESSGTGPAVGPGTPAPMTPLPPSIGPSARANTVNSPAPPESAAPVDASGKPTPSSEELAVGAIKDEEPGRQREVKEKAKPTDGDKTKGKEQKNADDAPAEEQGPRTPLTIRLVAVDAMVWDVFGRCLTLKRKTGKPEDESEKYREVYKRIVEAMKSHPAPPRQYLNLTAAPGQLPKGLEEHLVEKFTPQLVRHSTRPLPKRKVPTARGGIAQGPSRTPFGGGFGSGEREGEDPVGGYGGKREGDGPALGTMLGRRASGGPDDGFGMGAGAVDGTSCPPKPKRIRHVALHNPDGTRKSCGACGKTKTPLWRRGPKGPSTLCNACGAKWRAGRLVVPDVAPPPIFELDELEAMGIAPTPTTVPAPTVPTPAPAPALASDPTPTLAPSGSPP